MPNTNACVCSVVYASTGSVTLKLKQNVLRMSVSASTTSIRGCVRTYASAFARAARGSSAARTPRRGKNSLVRIASRPSSTARKLIALTMKQTPTPAKPRMMPASDGPKMRDALKRLELSAIAFGSVVAPDHPVRQLLARRHVEHEDRPVDERDRVQHPRPREAAERDPRERDRGDELRDLRPEHEPARVEPVGEHAGEESEERERQELRERHQPDREASRRA